MSLRIAEIEFHTVAIVDDDEQARQGYRYPIEELGLEPVLVDGPLDSIQGFVRRVSASGVLCDFHLRKKTYASFNGDELAKALYVNKTPVVMCTTYTDTDVLMFRRFRRFYQ